VSSPPAVNPYNKDEIEYSESGFDYAPQYPGTYNYSQSGIQYNESNFTYVKRDVTISADTVACLADLSPVFTYVYSPKRPGGIAYSSGHDYNKAGFDYNERDTSIPDTRPLVDYNQSGVAYSNSPDTGHTYDVIATPSAITVTTTFSAVPSVPATVTPSLLACPVTIIPAIEAQTIVVDGGITVPAAIPTIISEAIALPAEIEATATVPVNSLYITVDATQDDSLERTATIPAVTASSSYTALPDVIAAVGTAQSIDLYRLVVIPTQNIVPTIGLREDSSPAARALMRHYSPGPRGDNIFIINGTTVQSYLPTDWLTVTRWIYGGHESPRDLTTEEETLLVAAGYSFRVGPE